MLPDQEQDEQRVERKRHLGNDVVLLIFKDGNSPFYPSCLHSHFNRIFYNYLLFIITLIFL